MFSFCFAMAEDGSIFIIDAKIQKQRLNDMKNAAKRKKLRLVNSYSSSVTYIVTEYKQIGQVLRWLGLSSEDELTGSNVVSLEWFSASLRAGKLIPVEPNHRIRSATTDQEVIDQHRNQESGNTFTSTCIPDYACQRSTPLKHHNERFTNALEVLEKCAELRDTDQEYSRALAFRRASCVLKSLSFPLTNIRPLNNVTHIGGHSKRVIQELLEDRECQEVAQILSDPWFQKMKLFTGVFGVGPATAKKWIEKGWTSIHDAQQGSTSSDWRVKWGLAFDNDLRTPVSRDEAYYIEEIVGRHLQTVCPGALMELIGGFRRGKKQGHDVDILITHPKDGNESGCLTRLLRSLQSCDFILCGNHEASTYSDEVLVRDFKLSARGQLDHFEKWLGIVKVPKSVHERCATENSDGGVTHSCTDGKLKSGMSRNKQESECGSNENGSNVPSEGTSIEGEASGGRQGKNSDKQGTNVGEQLNETDGSVGEFGAQAKLQRQGGISGKSPMEQSKEKTEWIARRVDLIVSPYTQYFYALVGWTGNKQFNRDLRTYAPRVKGMKLTSHGLYDLSKGVIVPAGSEKEVFDNLGLTYREPCDRNC